MTATAVARDKARVFILYAGGTIGMGPEDPAIAGSPLVPKPMEDIKPYVPEIDRLDIAYEFGSVKTPKDSADLGPKEWRDIAMRIKGVYEEYDGFVILHGTDTLSFMASALAFLFENLGKPVVITGSQLPLSAVRTDAKMNFINAIHVAGYKATGLRCIPEVVVVFADKILRGCRTRKMSGTRLSGFDSPNSPPLGTIGEHIEIDHDALRRPPDDLTLHVGSVLSDEVISVSLYPGMRPSHLHKILEMEDVSAVVLQTFGAGNAPVNQAFLDVIAKAEQQGKIIVNVTQCPEGIVEMGRYEASLGLVERGVVSGFDMTPAAALTKLMWLLDKGNRRHTRKDVIAQMQINQRGEQSENQFDLRDVPVQRLNQPQPTICVTYTSDPRLDMSKLIRANVRISGLEFTNADEGTHVGLRVFVDQQCVAELLLQWNGVPVSRTIQIDNSQPLSGSAGGNIALTIISDDGKQLQIEDLCLTIFTKV